MFRMDGSFSMMFFSIGRHQVTFGNIHSGSQTSTVSTKYLFASQYHNTLFSFT